MKQIWAFLIFKWRASDTLKIGISHSFLILFGNSVRHLVVLFWATRLHHPTWAKWPRCGVLFQWASLALHLERGRSSQLFTNTVKTVWIFWPFKKIPKLFWVLKKEHEWKGEHEKLRLLNVIYLALVEKINIKEFLSFND